jgi:hypothetical protein
MPISPATQREVEATMRTAPVVELTQAETFEDTGAATAGAAANSKQEITPRGLREYMDSSIRVVLQLGKGGV